MTEWSCLQAAWCPLYCGRADTCLRLYGHSGVIHWEGNSLRMADKWVAHGWHRSGPGTHGTFHGADEAFIVTYCVSTGNPECALQAEGMRVRGHTGSCHSRVPRARLAGGSTRRKR